MLTGYQLSDLGVVCALGVSKEQVLQGLLAGDTSGIVSETGYFFDNSKPVHVGKVPLNIDSPEYALPEALKVYESRNNRILLLAIQQIESAVQKAIQEFGASRVSGCFRYQYLGCD